MNWEKVHEYNKQQMANWSPATADQFAMAVMQLQQGLRIAVDGMFGPHTRLAMAKSRQQKMHLIPIMIGLARKQAGKPYLFGAEVRMDDPDPPAFDCSELVQWSARNAGLFLPDGSWNQVAACRLAGTLIDVETAATVRGALLFDFGDGNPFAGARPDTAHVAISLGDGMTIEARSPRYGVGSWPIAGRRWTHAGLVPR